MEAADRPEESLPQDSDGDEEDPHMAASIRHWDETGGRFDETEFMTEAMEQSDQVKPSSVSLTCDTSLLRISYSIDGTRLTLGPIALITA